MCCWALWTMGGDGVCFFVDKQGLFATRCVHTLSVVTDANEFKKNPIYDSYPPPCHPSQTSLRKMSPAAPSRRTNPAEKAATKAMRSEVRALLKLKRTPFEDKLMKLFTRDELVSLYRRSVGLQKDVPNDAVARQTKQWSKRTLAGKIHGLVKARSFGMLDGIVVAVFAILGGIFGWRFRRGDGRTGQLMGRQLFSAVPLAEDKSVLGCLEAPLEEDESVQYKCMSVRSIGVGAEKQPRETQPRETQRILIATLCAVIAGGGWAGIAHGIKVSERTRFRNRFAKQLRTLRAKRPSATSRRLTRFVKRFAGKK